MRTRAALYAATPSDTLDNGVPVALVPLLAPFYALLPYLGRRIMHEEMAQIRRVLLCRRRHCRRLLT